MEEHISQLKREVLPTNFRYFFEDTNVKNNENFTCKTRVNIYDEKKWHQWLQDFESKTHTKWIVASTNPCDKLHSKFHYYKNYVCHHSSKNKKDDSKRNLGCSAKLSVRIKKDNKHTRCRDPHVKNGLFAIVVVEYEHNHKLTNATAWNMLRPRDELYQVFVEYFRNDLKPAAAKRYHEELLEQDDLQSLADSSKNPPLQWIHHQYRVWRDEELGGVTNSPEFLRTALERRDLLLEQGYKMAVTSEPFCIAVVTPLMQRFLEQLEGPQSLFIDTSASCDQTNSSITTVLAASKAGSIPIGIAIHDSQNVESYTNVFQQLKLLWEPYTNLSICNFMTDDGSSLKIALKAVWPEVRQLLCHFHILQALWNWLFKSQHQIPLLERKKIMNKFKEIMYADTASKAKLKYEHLLTYSRKYKLFQSHLKDLYSRRNEWAMSFRLNVLNRNNNTNNFAEATFRIFKDLILTRLKAFNAIALLDFICFNLEKYYKMRLKDYAYDRVSKPYLLFKKFIDKGNNLLKSRPNCVSELEDGMFSVESEKGNSSYIVDSSIGVCSCYNGSQGAFCKHQAAVNIKFEVPFPNSPNLTSSDRKSLFYIAYGHSSKINPQFFDPIQSPKKSQLTATSSTVSKDSSICSNLIMNENVNREEEKIECNSEIPPIKDPEVTISNFENQMSYFAEILRTNSSDPYLMKVTDQFTSKSNKVKTPMQLSRFLVSIGHSARMGGRKIKVQSTSSSRRKSTPYRGNTVQRSGRPLLGVRKSIKRPRNLSLNINLNRTNAKSHGEGH